MSKCSLSIFKIVLQITFSFLRLLVQYLHINAAL